MEKAESNNHIYFDNTRSVHNKEPDYDRPFLKISKESREQIFDRMKFIYGEAVAKANMPELERILEVYYAHKKIEAIEKEKEFDPRERFTEKDMVLITYGDLLKGDEASPLATLAKFCDTYLEGTINTLHILPFFPYSSDRGFSIIDFESVDPNLGTWDDIEDIEDRYQLMFDGVINHVSSKSRWFQEFLNQNPDYADFFTVFSTKEIISEDHLRLLVRPRTSEVLTPFETLNGRQLVWTTFSPDQVDLNFKNPKVLVKMVEILLTYVRRGADIIRLDAVTYLWDELGTTGVHLKQSHTIIKLFREVLDAVAPHVALLTETNVPHRDNIEYFGNGNDEAQMVYNFALPPLVLFTFYTGNAAKLTKWAQSLENISDTTTYFNFLDSHDGIGVMAVKDILTANEIEQMSYQVLEHGGFISYKKNSDGSESPYELNITWYSAINREDKNEPVNLQVKRYLASRAIALIMMGVPGVYLHGLLGSKNDAEAVIAEKETRSINRKVVDKKELIKALENPDTTTFKVSTQFVKMILVRNREKAFHPNATQQVLSISEKLFSVVRISLDKQEYILTIINVTNQEQNFSFDLKEINFQNDSWFELLTKKKKTLKKGKLLLTIEPYGIYWLKAT